MLVGPDASTITQNQFQSIKTEISMSASSLAEGQKGVLTTGLLKLFGPLFLVLPGLIAFAMFPDLGAANADHAYDQLVNAVLPT
ncbi:MAG TPA: hypothetical protein DEP13_00360, partial [Gammaproteobacteria bacterium]|nr:hypothetical protein [Gammaproteobacteria bacterium]